MFTRRILLFTLAISSWLLARASFVDPALDKFVQEFTKSCNGDGTPVCGASGQNYFLFPNECLLDEVNAENLFGFVEKIKKVPVKFCINGCDLMCPQVYEPVCTLNVNTQERRMFRSMCEATEHACRINADFIQLHPTACEEAREEPQLQFTEVLPNSMKFLGKRSQRTKPIPCTSVFSPVCGTYRGVKSTFKNECLLNAENIKLQKDWRVIKYGICDEDFANVRRNPNNKPSNGHSIKKRSYRSNPNYMSFHNRDRDYMAASKPDTDMSTRDDMYRYMPQVFEEHYVQRDLPNLDLKEHVTNNIIRKIMALPAPIQDAPSQEHILEEQMEEDQRLVAPNVTPLQYEENDVNVNFDYNRVNSKPSENHPLTSQDVERNEILRSESQAVNINSFAENNDNNKDNFYYPTSDVSSPPTPVLTERVQYIPESAINPTPVARSKVKKIQETTTQSPLKTKGSKTSPPVYFFISRRTTPQSLVAEKTIEKTSKKPHSVCQLGNEPICGVLSNGEVKTFDTICKMMATNSVLGNPWVKLHNGTCETCKTDCSREYKPICVQRNSVNYTMVNDCYYNMGICMDKRSKWKKIVDGECKRYTRIPDKYENIEPGFQYTSKYFVTLSTQARTSTTPMTPTTSTTVSSVISTTSATTTPTTKATNVEPSRRSRKRASSSNRKAARRARPPLNSKNIETFDSFVMNLAKRKSI